MEEIVSFMDGFKGMKEDHAYVLMRGRLQGTKACRLNVYDKRATPAVGLHCRKENKDFGHFHQQLRMPQAHPARSGKQSCRDVGNLYVHSCGIVSRALQFVRVENCRYLKMPILYFEL